jgi:hypothetical protein
MVWNTNNDVIMNTFSYYSYSGSYLSSYSFAGAHLSMKVFCYDFCLRFLPYTYCSSSSGGSQICTPSDREEYAWVTALDLADGEDADDHNHHIYVHYLHLNINLFNIAMDNDNDRKARRVEFKSK